MTPKKGVVDFKKSDELKPSRNDNTQTNVERDHSNDFSSHHIEDSSIGTSPGKEPEFQYRRCN